MVKELPAALELLLICLSQRSDDQKRHAFAHSNVDWVEFFALAKWHRVTPQIYRQLRRLELSCVPTHIMADLKAHVTANTCRVLSLTAEMIKLTHIFNLAHIRCLTIKGTPLAMQLYDDVTARECRDIDLLIAPEDLRQAHKLILEQGYVQKYGKIGLSPKQHSFYLKHRKDAVYWHPQACVSLELHWRLCNEVDDFSVGMDELCKNATTLQMGDVPIRTLSPEYNMMYLAAHGSGHAWSYLYWLADIERSLSLPIERNWEAIIAQAKICGVYFRLIEAILLAHRLLKAPLPAAIEKCSERHAHISSLLTLSIKIICQRQAQSPQIYLIKLARLAKLRLLIKGTTKRLSQYFFDAMPEDWEQVSLPDSLFFLYYPLRPLLWFWREVTNWSIKKTVFQPRPF